MDENHQHRYNPVRRFFTYAASYLFIDKTFDVIHELVSSRPMLTIKTPIREMAIALGTGALGLIVDHLIGLDRRKRICPEDLQSTTALTPLPPTTPPMLPSKPEGMALSQIPQILDLLYVSGQITADQQARVLEGIRQGRKGFAGELAVADGFITQDQLTLGLAQQSALKAEAALADINQISQFGSLPHSPWLKANWGNNGANPTVANPTPVDGLAAAANAAQNLVMLANANPDISLMPAYRNGVLAAVNLARGIAQGDSPVVPLSKMADSWRATVNQALTVAAQANPAALVDANGQPVDVQQFIANRDAEIAAAVQQTLAQAPGKDAGQTR